jgi:hypothetical protein
MAGGLKRSQGVGIKFGSIRLEIDASIPFESESVQRGEEFTGKVRNAAFAIEVVDPDKPATGCAACAQVAAGSG